MEGEIVLRMHYATLNGEASNRMHQLAQQFEGHVQRAQRILTRQDVLLDESTLADFVRHFGRMVDTLQRASVSRYQEEDADAGDT